MEALVQAVQKRLPLYDKNDSQYSNRRYICQLWKEVADEIGIDDPAMAKRKWMALRDYYRRQVRQDARSSASTVSTPATPFGVDKKKKWYMFDSMQFLLPYLGGDRATPSNNALTDDEDDALADNFNDDDSFSSWPPTTTTVEAQAGGQETGDGLHLHLEQTPPVIGAKRKRPKFPQEKEAGGRVGVGGRRNSEPSDFDRQILEAIKKMGERVVTHATVVKAPPSSTLVEVGDADDLFLKSLALQMRHLEPIAKMECQNEMHSTVLKYMKLSHSHSHSQAHGCPSSASALTPNTNTNAGGCGHYSDHAMLQSQFHQPHNRLDPDCSGNADDSGADVKV